MIKRFLRALRTIRNKRREPLHIEFNLTDYCNLNCKGCSHYSPVASEVYEDLETLDYSMKTVAGAANVDLLESVYLIGGETLLYPRLIEAMHLARKHFPYIAIKIFTNGLLLPKMNEEFWKACRETGCIIALTRYPVKFDYDKVETLCRAEGVAIEVFGDRSQEASFFKLPLDPERKQKGWLSHFRCISYGCITVENDKIFPCSQAACVGHLNRKFGTEFEWRKGDFIHIEDLTDIRQLYRLRNRPVPFCKYCKPIAPVAYGPSRRTADEWL